MPESRAAATAPGCDVRESSNAARFMGSRLPGANNTRQIEGKPRAGLETATGRANHREMIGIVGENGGSGQAEYSLAEAISVVCKEVVLPGN
jgi:hypothetical protein